MLVGYAKAENDLAGYLYSGAWGEWTGWEIGT